MVVIRSAVRDRVGAPGVGRRRPAVRVLSALVLCLTLTACSVTRPTIARLSVPTPTATANPLGSSAPTATAPSAPPTVAAVTPTAVPTATATATAPATAPATAAASTSTPTPTPAATATPPETTPTAVDAAAIKAVIMRGNQEEISALSANDPTLMRDTATASYYQQLQTDVSDLVGTGATSIALVKLVWRSVGMTGTTTARATTVETWSTTFSDGGVLVGTDTNLYTLVKQQGAWKIQTDDQPGSRPAQPAPGSAAAPTPAPPVSPDIADQSSNWAGYSATGGTFTSITGNWTVPTVTPGSGSSADATWVGIGGANTRDLIQAGTEATVEGGQVTYDAWLELLPRSEDVVPMDVSAGDAVRVTVAEQSAGHWQIEIVDTTTSYDYKISVAYASSHSSAEWIEEAPAVGRRQQAALDDFGSVHFTNGTTVENGTRRTIKQAGGQATSLYGQSTAPLAQPSVLGADGASFTVTRTGAP
ncbi:MAG TPA: G1 family glutamic endopeptidase [Thermomicrobiaceae bacterium]|nr:G1 family glutamic endopeptidase [Thermomicrobiaceae bacterium]